MKLTIFSRLTIGYLTLFLLIGGIAVYAIYKLHQLNRITRKTLNLNSPIIDHKGKLVDAILSQLRFKKKYLLNRDPLFYQQFLSARNDFDHLISLVSSVADTDEKKASLKRIADHYQHFHSLVEKEIEQVRKRQTYSVLQYEAEIEKSVDGILEELGGLEVYARNDIQRRMKTLVESTSTAQPWVIGLSLLAILLVVVLSVFITRSITLPLSQLTHKTEEISKGVYNCNLAITSPPELMKLAKAFNEMCAQLNALDQMKADFFSSMSHELRTPLTSIKEGISLLQKNMGGEFSPQHRRILTILSEETRRLIDLTNSLLDLSKMEAGMMTYTFESSRITSLIHRVATELTPLLEAKKILLKIEGDQTIPELKLDRERILQALRNLMGNALKFTPEGGTIKISTRTMDSEIQVSVADTGPGIPVEKLWVIFEKFYQGPSSYGLPSKGTGLGLSIVKHIITAHGGRIWAENLPEGGSLFTFVLPVSS